MQSETRSKCLLCRAEPTGTLFCDFCKPDTCLNCSASDVHVTEHTVQCSHGCEQPITEYTAQKLFTVALNGTSIEKLAYAGPRVELIIPTGTPVQTHRDRPSNRRIPDDHILTTHYTHTGDELARTGIQYPPHDHAVESDDTNEDHVRTNAVFAWPYTPTYVSNSLSWENAEQFFLAVPESSVTVSSYRFLDMVGQAEYAIPPEKYEESLTFTISELRTTVRTHNRPCRPADLEIM